MQKSDEKRKKVSFAMIYDFTISKFSRLSCSSLKRVPLQNVRVAQFVPVTETKFAVAVVVLVGVYII